MVVDNIPKTNVLYTNTNGPDHVVYFKLNPEMNMLCKTSKVIYVINWFKVDEINVDKIYLST